MARDKQNRAIWLGVGVMAGLTTGWLIWRRWRARATSPMHCFRRPRTALVTGASSGIGEAYARRLACEGFNLILVARRESRLVALADVLTREYGIQADVLVADLAHEDGITSVERCIAEVPDLCMLVNNAGFSLTGSFTENDTDRQDAMIRLHVNAAVRLTRAALPVFLAQNHGAIVNVASLMAFYPLSGSATYAATKSYLKVFSEALHQELIGTVVRVQALCPGFTRTEIQEVSGVGTRGLPDFVWMSPEAVVEQSLRDLDKDRVVSVPGWGYRLLAAVSGFLPRDVIYVVGRWLDRWGRGSSCPTPGPFHKRTYERFSDVVTDVRFMFQNRRHVKEAMRLLDETFRERLMLAVTQVNQCRYCASFHAKYALTAGLSPEEVQQLLDGVINGCPAGEVDAVLYAQQWAEQAGHPDPEVRAHLVATYGEVKADAIDLVLRMINMGNLAGNTWDAILFRISGGRWVANAR